MTTEAKSEPVKTPSLLQSASAALAKLQTGLKQAPARLSAARAAAPGFVRNLWATQRHWLFVLIPLAFLLLRPLRWSWGTWFAGRGPFWGINEPLAFQAFILPAAALLAYSDRRRLQEMYQEMAFLFPEGSPKRRGHLWPVLVACTLLLCSCIALMEPLALFSLILLLGSVVYFLYGPFILRALLGPLLFLFLMLPPPGLLLLFMAFHLPISGAVTATQILQPVYPAALSRGPSILLPNYLLDIGVDLSGMGMILASLAFTLWVILFRRVRFGLALISLIASVAICLAITIVRILVVAVAGSLSTPVGDAFLSIKSFPFTVVSLYLSYRFTVWLQTRRRRLSDYEADLALQAQEAAGQQAAAQTPFSSVHPDRVARPAFLHAAAVPLPDPEPEEEILDETLEEALPDMVDEPSTESDITGNTNQKREEGEA